MRKKSQLLVAFINAALVGSLSFSSIVLAEEEHYADAFSFGGGIGLHESGAVAKLEVKSPTLFEVGTENLFTGRYSLFLEGGVLYHNNIQVQGEDKLQRLASTTVGFGLHVQKEALSKALSVYGRLGGLMIKQPTELSKKASYGGLLGFGIEFPYEARTNLYGSQVRNAYFVQMDVYLAMARADELPGQPDFSNGPSVLIGSRSYF